MYKRQPLSLPSACLFYSSVVCPWSCSPVNNRTMQWRKDTPSWTPTRRSERRSDFSTTMASARYNATILQTHQTRTTTFCEHRSFEYQWLPRSRVCRDTLRPAIIPFRTAGKKTATGISYRQTLAREISSALVSPRFRSLLALVARIVFGSVHTLLR